MPWPFGGGRWFPGTNMQDLNLDWIIRRVRDLSKGIIAPWINPANYNWMVYDVEQEEFVDSGISAAGEGVGPPGPQGPAGPAGPAGPQGEKGDPGEGIPAGGAAGNVLIKDGAQNYSAAWSSTPPLMQNFAAINSGATAVTSYNAGDYLVYDGILYKANTAIAQDTTLDPGPGGNIEAITVKDAYYDINTKGTYAISFVASGYITSSGNYVDCYLPFKIKPGLTCAFSLQAQSTTTTFIGSTRLENIIDSVTILRQDNFGITLEAHFATNQSTYANNQATVSVIGINLIVS